MRKERRSRGPGAPGGRRTTGKTASKEAFQKRLDIAALIEQGVRRGVQGLGRGGGRDEEVVGGGQLGGRRLRALERRRGGPGRAADLGGVPIRREGEAVRREKGDQSALRPDIIQERGGIQGDEGKGSGFFKKILL